MPESGTALLVEEAFARADVFDVIHCDTESIHLPLARRCLMPVLTTLPLVSISNAQRAPLHWASWAGTVHHGLPLELHRPHYDAGRYLVFLGRISQEKRVDRAIAMAHRAELPLKVAAKAELFGAARLAREYCSIHRNCEARWCRQRA